MIKQFIAICICLVSLSFTAQGQDDPVLFTVEGKPVHLSEFNYIYAKTNGDKADYSRKSLEEYLELYKNFKLKVQRARDMQLDTIPSLQRELAGYRQQLANSYLVDKEVTEVWHGCLGNLAVASRSTGRIRPRLDGASNVSESESIRQVFRRHVESRADSPRAIQ